LTVRHPSEAEALHSCSSFVALTDCKLWH